MFLDPEPGIVRNLGLSKCIFTVTVHLEDGLVHLTHLGFISRVLKVNMLAFFAVLISIDLSLGTLEDHLVHLLCIFSELSLFVLLFSKLFLKCLSNHHAFLCLIVFLLLLLFEMLDVLELGKLSPHVFRDLAWSINMSV